MNTSYKILFSIQLQHTFYTEGIAKDIRLVPTTKTQELLKRQRMLVRNTSQGLSVWYQAEASGNAAPLIPSPEQMIFTFSLYADDVLHFSNITDLEIASALPFFRNDPAVTSDEESLSSSMLDQVEGALFNLKFEDSRQDVILKVENRAEQLVAFKHDLATDEGLTQVELSAPNNSFEQQIDLRAFQDGPFRIFTNASFDKKMYVSRSLNSRPPLAIVELTYLDSAPQIAGKEFILPFSRRQTTWTYYIVNKNKQLDLVADPPRIELESTNSSDNPYDGVSFGPAQQLTDDQDLIQDLETWVIRSEAPVPFYEMPLVNLQLWSDQKMLIEYLPNPSPTTNRKWNSATQQYESEIFIYV